MDFAWIQNSIYLFLCFRKGDLGDDDREREKWRGFFLLVFMGVRERFRRETLSSSGDRCAGDDDLLGDLLFGERDRDFL